MPAPSRARPATARAATEPTISDANLVLGYLNPDGLLGGRLPLDLRKAAEAIKTRRRAARHEPSSGRPMACSPSSTTTWSTASAASRWSAATIPRDFVLVGAGGATAAHITALAREMGIDTDHPAEAGVRPLRLRPDHLGREIQLHGDGAAAPRQCRGLCKRIDTLFKRDREAQGISISKVDGFKKAQIGIKRSLDMRYVGQVHECTVEIGTFEINGKTIEKVKDAFHKRHEELYTYSERHNAVEVVNIESTLYGHVDKPKPPKHRQGRAAGQGAERPPQGDLQRRRQGRSKRRSMTATARRRRDASPARPSSRR